MCKPETILSMFIILLTPFSWTPVIKLARGIHAWDKQWSESFAGCFSIVCTLNRSSTVCRLPNWPYLDVVPNSNDIAPAVFIILTLIWTYRICSSPNKCLYLSWRFCWKVTVGFLQFWIWLSAYPFLLSPQSDLQLIPLRLACCNVSLIQKNVPKLPWAFPKRTWGNSTGKSES